VANDLSSNGQAHRHVNSAVSLQHRGRVVGAGVDDDVHAELAGQRELLAGDVFAVGIVLYGGAVPLTGPDAQ
jgi:hypothetical protein